MEDAKAALLHGTQRLNNTIESNPHATSQVSVRTSLRRNIRICALARHMKNVTGYQMMCPYSPNIDFKFSIFCCRRRNYECIQCTEIHFNIIFYFICQRKYSHHISVSYGRGVVYIKLHLYKLNDENKSVFYKIYKFLCLFAKRKYLIVIS